MKFKVVSQNGAYLVRSPEVVRLDLGADANAAKAYGVRSMVYELLPEGAEIEGAHIQAGPHLEAVDAEAEAAMQAYWAAWPGATLDPTRSLPLGQDPMQRPTFESATLAMLERMAAEASGQSSVVSGQKEDPRIDQLTDALAKLTNLVTQLATPPAPSPRKAA